MGLGIGKIIRASVRMIKGTPKLKKVDVPLKQFEFKVAEKKIAGMQDLDLSKLKKPKLSADEFDTYFSKEALRKAVASEDKINVKISDVFGKDMV